MKTTVDLEAIELWIKQAILRMKMEGIGDALIKEGEIILNNMLEKIK